MPIYEYRCRGCGGAFERLVGAREEAVVCPACASPDVARMLSLFGMKSGQRFAASTSGGGAGGCGCGAGGCGCH
jgi:putative FmdB family regulatory protein